ncbi:MAG: peptidoglycan-associated lipoprotein Pal [Burkholderiales bacterium]|nr:peptidoglycan-associated lipoprotein Pal [Burkholderiales bacterium]
MTTLTFGTRLIAAAAVLALVGCASSTKLDETPVETRNPTAVGGAAGSQGTTSPAGNAVPGSQVTTVSLDPNAGGIAVGRIVYFDFDSYAVKDDYRGLVESHAKQLSAAKAKRMLVEGHTDERGGSEYNLALGQKRAEAVVKAMELLGASPSQLEAVSFGKERPASEGHDEAAWAKNRRAELKDR